MSFSTTRKRTKSSSTSSSASKPALYALFEDRGAKAGETAAWLFEEPLEFLAPGDKLSLAAALGKVGANDSWWVTALDYELGYLLEPASAPAGWQPVVGRPAARFWRFGSCRCLSADELESWLAARLSELTDDERRAGVGSCRTALGEADYSDAVDRICEYIAAGDCYQVNFTFPLDFGWFGHPMALYGALRQRQPVRYGGFVATGDGAIISLSPELFLERQGDRIITRPMKGTAPSDTNPQALQDSEKNRAENLMIVDLLRNDLGRIAANGSVRVDSLFDIERYPTLWQMVSQVSADIPGRNLEEVITALFPCGSITGAPKIRAMQIIAQLEGQSRGLYTGALGWIAPGGDFRLNVAIRTLELEEGGQGRLGVGSGIVADSIPASEWRECLLKAAFLTDLDPGLQLIETLRLEDGSYPRLVGHVARLRASAAWFGFAWNEDDIRRRLAEQPSTGVWRVRLTLGKDGGINIVSVPLVPLATGSCFARLSPSGINSADPLRRHKTTVRALYDAALRGLEATPEIFDVVFLNERGEVAEGARSNVFVQRDGILLTPPLESGALPGVLRAELLASGQAREAVLWPKDLAGEFFLGNALRGLLPVRLLAG